MNRDSGLGADDEAEGNLVLDELSERLDAFRRLSKDDTTASDSILEQFGGRGKVETDIVSELAKRKSLWLPDRFEEAHRLAMRSLEVLDRNGARPAKLVKLGLLAPVATFLVQLVARFIVRNHQAEVINAIKNMYIRREANAPKESPERFMLRRARIDAERVQPTLKKNPIGVPAFLLGGAFFSSILSSVGRAISSAKSTSVGLGVLTVLLFLLFVSIAWVVLRGSAVARHRIHLSLDQPLKALWETVGAAGKPPKDSSRQFALIAIVLPALGFLVLVIGLVLAVLR